MPELNDCSDCGFKGEDIKVDELAPKVFHVECPKCGNLITNYESRSSAIDEWNEENPI